jgi:hypothetical protein
MLDQSKFPCGLSNLRARRIDSNLDNLKISCFHIYQCNDFISPMQRRLVPLTIRLWTLKIKYLGEILPWGCKPFYSPRKAKLARKNPRRV